MRIGILKESLCIGGTERSAANTSKILSTEHEVYVALYDASDIKYSFGGKLVDFYLPAKNKLLYKIANNIFRILKYKSLIKKEKLDLLYEFISINNPISRIKHKSAIRIISSRDFSVLSTNTERFNQCLSNADAMICNSQYLREFFITKHPEQKEKVFTVYNYIDINEIQEQSLEDTDDEFKDFLARHSETIVSVGRFCKEKGFEYLIESFALSRKHNNVGLVLVGDGDYRSKYQAVIDKYDLASHVFFTGFQKNPYKYMKSCSVFVLSSLSEGFPNVLAEAMALGLPVIATNCFSGPAEILRKDSDYYAVKDKYTESDFGIITPTLNTEDKSNAILELSNAISNIVSDQKLRTKYAELAIQRAKVFSEEAMRIRLNEIFNTLAKRREA